MRDAGSRTFLGRGPPRGRAGACGAVALPLRLEAEPARPGRVADLGPEPDLEALSATVLLGRPGAMRLRGSPRAACSPRNSGEPCTGWAPGPQRDHRPTRGSASLAGAGGGSRAQPEEARACRCLPLAHQPAARRRRQGPIASPTGHLWEPARGRGGLVREGRDPPGRSRGRAALPRGVRDRTAAHLACTSGRRCPGARDPDADPDRGLGPFIGAAQQAVPVPAPARGRIPKPGPGARPRL